MIKTPVIVQTIVLLVCSNVFMTFAWYAHLRDLRARPLVVAVLASWGIAFFEYMLKSLPTGLVSRRSISVS